MSAPRVLDENTQATLLAAAWDAVEASALGRAPRPHPEESLLEEPAACFVTLREASGALRGCIGETEARRPLAEAVRWAAIGAATRDPRFRPLAAAELAGLRLGISILGADRRIHGPAEVRVGVDGLRITLGSHRGLLLPEVAVDHDLDATGFLAALCQKAGLEPDAWRRPEAELSAFETTHFGGGPRTPREP